MLWAENPKRKKPCWRRGSRRVILKPNDVIRNNGMSCGRDAFGSERGLVAGNVPSGSIKDGQFD
jgi:hypothetical protein